MRTLNLKLPRPMWEALERRQRETGQPIAHIVRHILGEFFAVEHSTLFQVSTAAALVNGIYRGAVTISQLRRHGGFGLGTFEGLDGEMVACDGRFYHVHSDGAVNEAGAEDLTPFAVVTDFSPDQSLEMARCKSLDELLRGLDRMRASNNLFYAIRIDGAFQHMHTRAMCRTREGMPLAMAAAHQPEFKLAGASGTIVGFWSPSYIQALEIPGYHFHFVDAGRTAGGHVLGLSGGPLRIQIARLRDFQLALPASAEYLRADLEHDPSRDLELAEKARKAGKE